jgi:hypothetical protein
MISDVQKYLGLRFFSHDFSNSPINIPDENSRALLSLERGIHRSQLETSNEGINNNGYRSSFYPQGIVPLLGLAFFILGVQFVSKSIDRLYQGATHSEVALRLVGATVPLGIGTVILFSWLTGIPLKFLL